MEPKYQEIMKLVSLNKLDQALLMLNNLGGTENSSRVTLLESRFNKLKKTDIDGLINRDDYDTELNNIKFSVLQLAEELDIPQVDSFTGTTPMSIKKIVEDEKIRLNFERKLTGDIFEIQANPNTEVGELARQILTSFYPDYENNFLFKENRMFIKVKKIIDNSNSIELDNDKNIKESNLLNDDSIFIEFELKVPKVAFTKGH